MYQREVTTLDHRSFSCFHVCCTVRGRLRCFWYSSNLLAKSCDGTLTRGDRRWSFSLSALASDRTVKARGYYSFGILHGHPLAICWPLLPGRLLCALPACSLLLPPVPLSSSFQKGIAAGRLPACQACDEDYQIDRSISRYGLASGRSSFASKPEDSVRPEPVEGLLVFPRPACGERAG